MSAAAAPDPCSCHCIRLPVSVARIFGGGPRVRATVSEAARSLALALPVRGSAPSQLRPPDARYTSRRRRWRAPIASPGLSSSWWLGRSYSRPRRRTRLRARACARAAGSSTAPSSPCCACSWWWPRSTPSPPFTTRAAQFCPLTPLCTILRTQPSSRCSWRVPVATLASLPGSRGVAARLARSSGADSHPHRTRRPYRAATASRARTWAKTVPP